MLQNTDGKTYTEDASETINGTTGTTTVAAARAYKGFTAQEVNQAKVKQTVLLSLKLNMTETAIVLPGIQTVEVMLSQVISCMMLL